MLTKKIEEYLLKRDLIQDNDKDEILIDAQEYGIGELIALGADEMQPWEVIVLDQMIETWKSLEEIDVWLKNKIPWYDLHTLKAMDSVISYVTIK